MEALQKSDSRASAAVWVALEQIEADPDVIDKLTTRGDVEFNDQHVNVKPWHTARRIHNLWRFRILETPATSYRIVYGYHWQVRKMCILAVVHKDKFDYDSLDTAIAERIFADWNELTGGQST